MSARRVVVIGGGLAGISAAVDLCDAGLAVTLLEARPRLGGATCSFDRHGLTIDNGQHVFLRCCTAYRQLLDRLGGTGSVWLQDKFDVSVLGGARAARLRRSALPGPLHMGLALARYSPLSVAERLQVARAAAALRFVRPAGRGVDEVSLGDWLSKHGQSEHARRALWDLFIVSALNVAGDQASLSLAATVARTALLGRRAAADIGVPAVPLGRLHGEAARKLLGGLGAGVHTGTKATAVRPDPAGGWIVELGTGELGRGELSGGELSADAVVLAVPAAAAARLTPSGLAAGAARWAELGWSPIVNVHVVYDRQVTSLPMAAAINSPVQWVFDKTGSAGLQSGQYLAISLSAADGYVDVPAADLRKLFVPELARLFPAAAEASIVDFFVTRERRATFRQVPGTAVMRPAQATQLPGLALAGAWTDTGWPDTMEGAVRSGQAAAAHLLPGLVMTGARRQRPPAVIERAGAPS
jgi:squalene-associated FAD-dependent desaturase